mmetsp:Transcript_28999/g.53292  ORF Transcript_28999/g.53292 Transcript_28999/m.53292 type:complete len:259 (-) Transcript_28999:337-1113(-)|eukprot:CAMPEP_0175073724 /NCGR_PEP_ID=MMETSP0052_2-20121109/20778_1 /TAXON_ID=51329 ORGANISM="Polytomella parva, Strain SAG 63-3" /NCGR_SAMPLE_ID=MMETSP0052_2 /ASSEMBLY_ACC=CAM_ASM_000194 /LENGTH=258 /DNA_ID=CAMNT_0016341679 /DNA_START=91 /DNA_END=867 /DNA_ORIENTATION=-
MNLLSGYDSDSSTSERHDDSDNESSLDSAGIRARDAERRLKAFEDEVSSAQTKQNFRQKPLLLAPEDALSTVLHPPDFLDPEATRQLNAFEGHGESISTGSSNSRPDHRLSKRKTQKPGKDFDISVLAPPLKGSRTQSRSVWGNEEQDLPPGAVIEASAKRYRVGGEVAGQGSNYSNMAIALMGGNVPIKGSGSTSGPTSGSKTMGVPDFLSKGHGGAQLPRKNQDRKEKEKEKRMKGQSSHKEWKSEAEMVLRQQYD